MRRVTAVTRWIVRVAGLIQILLGLSFWTGHALSLVPVHMAVGMVVVLGLWATAVFAARAGAHPGLVALAIALGLVLPIVGVTQGRLLPGSLHWVIQVVHLLLGLGALRMADGLAEYALRCGAAQPARESWGAVGRRRMGAQGGLR